MKKRFAGTWILLTIKPSLIGRLFSFVDEIVHAIAAVLLLAEKVGS